MNCAFYEQATEVAARLPLRGSSNYKDTVARDLIQIIFNFSVRKSCAFRTVQTRVSSFQLEFIGESDYQRGA
jgi:hypothetical protein